MRAGLATFYTEFSMAILRIDRRAFDNPNTTCQLATLASQAGHLLLAHACLHVGRSLHATSRPFAQNRLVSGIFRLISAKEADM